VSRAGRAFAVGRRGPLHILVDNAGVLATPERRTRERREPRLATNHLGLLGTPSPA
jgi:hypothetical protein